MTRFIFLLSLFAGLSLSGCTPPVASSRPDTTLVTAPGATLHVVSHQFQFTEGPAVDAAGNVFFTDQPNDRIWRYSTRGQLSVFSAKSGRANGLYFDQAGNLLACADEQNQLWSFAPDGQVHVLVRDVQGHRLNGPNDLWVQPGTGAIYFTDPYYQRDYWRRTRPDSALGGQKVYYLARPDHPHPQDPAPPVVVEDHLQQPNGIIGTPDGRQLYVADIGAGRTYRYQIEPTGQLSHRQLFVAQGSDGMTIDARGNVYLTGKGVTVYTPAGQLLQHIDVPAAWTGNVCFAGKDRRTLFITASGAVFTLPMRVSGVR